MSVEGSDDPEEALTSVSKGEEERMERHQHCAVGEEVASPRATAGQCEQPGHSRKEQELEDGAGC